MTQVRQYLKQLASRIYAHLNTPSTCTGFAVVIGSLFLITAAKGFRFQGGYPRTHWFFNYSVGFIKRGLVGTIVRPLFDFKSVQDIHECINTISFFVFFLAVALITLAVRHILIAHLKAEGRHCPVTLLSLLIFATAPAAVLAGLSVTFFDLFLVVYCILSIFALQAGRFLILVILSTAGIATHEIYFLYGYPVVLMALILQFFYVENGRSLLEKSIYLTVNILFPVLVFLLIGLTRATTNDQMIQDLAKIIAGYEIFSDLTIEQGIFPLSRSAILYLKHPPDFWTFLSDIKIVTTTYVATLFLLVALLALSASKRHKLITILLPLVVVAPLFLGVIAWDTHRFAAFTTIQCFYAFFVLKDKLTSPKPWTTILFVVLGLGVFINNLYQDVWYFHSRVNKNGVAALRDAPPIDVFRRCQELFPNATFEKGQPKNWTMAGDAFVFKLAESKEAANARVMKQLGPQGLWWISSKGKTPSHGTSPKGTMTSVPFTLERDRIMFMVMGKPSMTDLYVSVEIDGKEILRVTGSSPDYYQQHMFDVSRYKGKRARIRIVDSDDGRDGHISADGFCYSSLVKGGKPVL